jgi:hypothetical protein
MNDNTQNIRRQLAQVEAELAERTKQVAKSLSALEGLRDRLIHELSDLEGAHDRRPVAVR